MKVHSSEADERILSDPSASDWLKHALRTALQRDPVDALHDALALAEVLEERLREVLDESQDPRVAGFRGGA